MIVPAVSWKRCKTNRGMSEQQERKPHTRGKAPTARGVKYSSNVNVNHMTKISMGKMAINQKWQMHVYTYMYVYNVQHIYIVVSTYKSDN